MPVSETPGRSDGAALQRHAAVIELNNGDSSVTVGRNLGRIIRTLELFTA